MKIGVIGAATVGMTLAVRLAAAGHEVSVASRRGPQNLSTLLADSGVPLTPATTGQAMEADVVFLAVQWTRVRDVLTPGIAWGGRILVDATNIFLSYAPDFRVDDLHGESGSEIVARLAPSARVVKAFNTLPFAKMFASAPSGLQRVIPVAGDDDVAVSVVAGLIEAMGLHPLGLGSLADGGRRMEVGGPFSGFELLTPIGREVRA